MPDSTNHAANRFEPGKVALAPHRDAKFIPGRRNWVRYRDLGAKVASEGRLRAEVLMRIPGDGPAPTTGWHYHVCEGQFLYVLKGHVELQFEDGSVVFLGENDSLYIPGGLRHNESKCSDVVEVLELSFPADMGTVPCEIPEGWHASSGSDRPAQ